jgi:hypothetical protein
MTLIFRYVSNNQILAATALMEFNNTEMFHSVLSAFASTVLPETMSYE